MNIDPTVKDRQFCDVGNQYRTGDLLSRRRAAAGRRGLEGRAREVEALQGADRHADRRWPATFYPAEDYHQDYYMKNPVRYKFYRSGCGRDARLEGVLGRQGGSLDAEGHGAA